MATSQKSWFLYLFGFFQLISVILTEPNLIFSKDLVQERAGFPRYPIHYKVYLQDTPLHNISTGFTGFRSAFQWTIGKTIDNYGIHNAVQFRVKQLATGTVLGQIGIYSNGSQIGIHLSYDSVASSSPGPSFICSNNFPFWMNSHSCFNSNYSLISNAIYFLDVEIRGKTIRGYISKPQRDFTEMDDPYLPRTLIGEIHALNELTDLEPHHYWVANNCGSCNAFSEILTTNYAPEVYNKEKRTKTEFWAHSQYTKYLCDQENTLTLYVDNIFNYISRPSITFP